ncbi:MAG: TlpA family protein disulfide reductase [Saprospiraceae bacterium]|nr:TlpA family protein disulfide reductase [Saprospiraceae bacterium]
MILLAAAGLVLAGRYFYFLPRFSSGESAPDFRAVLPGGRPFQLEELRDRYVLLQFWGSWCGPCRSENPALAALYRKYGGAEFEIVSVGIERDTARWERAIAHDGMVWPYHFIEITPSLRFFNAPIANQFKIKKLPTLFLLRPGGAIQRIDPEIEALDELLGRELKGNLGRERKS